MKSIHKALRVIALNSASTLLLDTLYYFLLLHVTRFPKTKVQYLKVDRLSSIDPVEYASVKASNFLSFDFLKKNPFLGVILRYLMI